MRRLCTACHAIGEPLQKMRGELWIEVVLWAVALGSLPFGGWWVFLIALIYSLLRSPAPVCAACGSAALIPPGTPRAREIMGEARAALEAANASEEAEDMRSGARLLAGILAAILAVALLSKLWE